MTNQFGPLTAAKIEVLFAAERLWLLAMVAAKDNPDICNKIQEDFDSIKNHLFSNNVPDSA